MKEIENVENIEIKEFQDKIPIIFDDVKGECK